ncbi:MAG TPA: HAD family hydrolase, partial [Actinomycetota bacterium]|nr:HAD family hydrolase [Actinomycetota bacterium]
MSEPREGRARLRPEGQPRRSGTANDALRWVVWGTKVLYRGTAGIVSIARGGQMRAALRPWLEFDRAEDIPFEMLRDQGVRAVLFDLENTLIPAGGPFTQEAREVVKRVRAAGMNPGVVSNASAAWVPETLQAEGLPFVAPAGKPGREAFHEGCRLVGARPSETIYVGDQLITDVLGPQR